MIISDQEIVNLIYELTEAHRQLAKLCFNDDLKPIKITIEHKKRSDSKALAAFLNSQNSFLFKKEDSVICMYTSSLNGNFFEIIKILIHEMIHQYCHEHNIINTYATNGRHNKNFKRVAESVGFVYFSNEKLIETGQEWKINFRKLRGYSSEDDVTEELKNIILNLEIDKNIFKRLVHSDSLSKDKHDIDKMKVYFCKCRKIRSKDNLNIICLDCKEVFKIKN